MDVRQARVHDARQINELIATYAEQDRMLFRSLADIFEHLQTFLVAEQAGRIVGCCSLEVIWSDLAEIKSLAVAPSHQGAGIGTALVEAALERARQLGVTRVFALTLEPGFFTARGFAQIDKQQLPMKVWSDCARCPKQQDCDEVAMLKDLS